MARYYPFSTMIMGRRYTGDWSLQQGGQICIRSAWGSETVEVGARNPGDVAQEALGRIVGRYHTRQLEERERQASEAGRLGEEARAWAQPTPATLAIPDDWLPTAENVNALPEPLRRYVHQLETHADPQLTIQENFELREQVRALEAMLQRERETREPETKKARPPKRPGHASAMCAPPGAAVSPAAEPAPSPRRR